MMGFGQAWMMSLSWVAGLVAVALVWGGVWMLLSVIGVAPRVRAERSAESPTPSLPSGDTWQQPDFTSGASTSESMTDREAVRDGDEHR